MSALPSNGDLHVECVAPRPRKTSTDCSFSCDVKDLDVISNTIYIAVISSAGGIKIIFYLICRRYKNMAEEPKPLPNIQKRMETISINILQCKELRGQRGDQLTAMFKMEYGDKVLGESSKIETTAGQKQFDVNFSTTYSLNVEDNTQLDDICHRPFICMNDFIRNRYHYYPLYSQVPF